MWQGPRRRGFEQDLLAYDGAIEDVVAYLEEMLQKPDIKPDTRVGLRFVVSILKARPGDLTSSPECDTDKL